MHIFIGDTQCDTADDEPGRLLAPHSRVNHQAERTTCWHAVSRRIIAVVVCMFGSLAYAAALPGEENCVDGRSELTLTLREDASIAADYRLSQATRSLSGCPANRTVPQIAVSLPRSSTTRYLQSKSALLHYRAGWRKLPEVRKLVVPKSGAP